MSFSRLLLGAAFLLAISVQAFAADGVNSVAGPLPMGAGQNTFMYLVPQGAVGIGTQAPQATLDVVGGVKVGQTQVCGSAPDNLGTIRYNNTLNRMEFCAAAANAAGGEWRPIGGNFGGAYSEACLFLCGCGSCWQTNAVTGACSCPAGSSPHLLGSGEAGMPAVACYYTCY